MFNNRIFYEINVKRKDFWGTVSIIVFSIDEILKYINSKAYDKLISIKKYYKIYEHTKNLPEFDFYDNFTEEYLYNKNYKLEKNNLKSIRFKDYKDNLIANNNYEIKCSGIEKKKLTNYYFKITSSYKSNDLQEIKKVLYSYSLSTQLFDIILYQYEELIFKEEISEDFKNFGFTQNQMDNLLSSNLFKME